MSEESAVLAESAELRPEAETFSAGSGTASVVPQTANLADRTVDVVWYGGASVPRINRETGDPYMLRLDMAGANLGRLNAGAPVFDNHMTGSDFPSAMAGTVGTKAQIGVVQKAWADGKTGRATLQFAQNDPQADAVWNKVSQGIIQNLSFGAWINAMQPDEAVGPKGFAADDEEQNGPQSFVATAWEPFEISPVCIPADFSTTFLAAESQVPAETISDSLPAQKAVENQIQQPAEQEIMRASTARKENTPVMENTTQAAGAEARPEVNVEALKAEAIRAERERVQAIQLAAKPFGLEEDFTNSLIALGLSVQDSNAKILEKLANKAAEPKIKGEVAITRDHIDTRREQMECGLIARFNPSAPKEVKEKGRDYVGMSLLEMAKESLEAAGIKTRGMSKMEVAKAALNGVAGYETFATGYATTSDFPNVLANVANKSLRQAYEMAPSTFKPFCRQVTAADFKPVNRIQLSDVPALSSLNEHGEYTRTTPTDSKETYSLATFGKIIAISRQTVINDDLQAFTRIPQLLGMAAARLESDTVWAIITSNPNMSDGNGVFHSAHANTFSGGGTALGVSALASARANMRIQTGPQGTILNLVPTYILVPAALETTADQLVAPVNIASSSATNVVPTWIRSLNPIVEPRLDAASTTAWYLVADPSMIDTIEYCYLEGQAGVYTETRMGFDVDGLEIKARLDFAAAATEFRGLQKQAGA